MSAEEKARWFREGVEAFVREWYATEYRENGDRVYGFDIAAIASFLEQNAERLVAECEALAADEAVSK